MNSNKCVNCKIETLNLVTRKCSLPECDKVLTFCSVKCANEFTPKFNSCSRCGLVIFCKHALSIGSMCTHLKDSKICCAEICVRCSRESVKRFHKYLCCEHEP